MKRISKLFFGAVFFILGLSVLFSQEYNPHPHPDAVVVEGDVRFTILTPRVVRMEWSADGDFEDHASLVFVNRRLPVPEFQREVQDEWLVVETKRLRLKYKLGSGRFTQRNLQVEFQMEGRKKLWRPGMENRGNLKGTIRTLDGFDGRYNHWKEEKVDLGKGLISKEGWVLIDDSRRPLFDRSQWPWVIPRPKKDQQDWYFFGYGYDYKTALNDFTKIAGKIPLPPKYAFGSWWSRYWEYTDWELRELVHEFEIHDIPLDVLVVDMDWHITTKPEWYEEGEKIKDQAGQSAGWTGFTWNRNYFPHPEDFLEWTEDQGLKVCLNLHPASGIQPHERNYPQMARAMGIDPESQKYVPFDIVDKNYARNFLDIILHPMEKKGVDFWWLDWQQWSTTEIPGVNPTFYLNYVFFSDMKLHSQKRPLIMHRYGGLGNHRYQIGFSGDTYINWRSLDFQPYFTSTASNVCFGFWSHDIGGHMRGESTPQLYTRWVQWGAFSPILRTHCTKDPSIERRIWAYPLKNFHAMRNAFLLRYALMPYIYTAARKAHDTGISMCRPLYYSYPQKEEAYRFKNQYMYGDDLMVAPVTQPMEEGHLYVSKEIWLPPGRWVEWFSGTSLEGGKVVQRAFAIDEIPVYVREGAIIPMQPQMSGVGEKPVNPLILNVFPGNSGSTRVYDDEGNSQGYLSGEFTFTPVHFQKENQEMELIIEPIQGSYPGMIESRAYKLKFPLTLPPEKVRVNGEPLSYREEEGKPGWNYNGGDLTACVLTPEVPVKEKVVVHIQFPQTDRTLLSGKKGAFRDLIKFAKVLANNNWDKSKYSNDKVVHAAQTGLRMTLRPQTARSELQEFDSEWEDLLSMIQKAVQENKALKPAFQLLQTAF